MVVLGCAHSDRQKATSEKPGNQSHAYNPFGRPKCVASSRKRGQRGVRELAMLGASLLRMFPMSRPRDQIIWTVILVSYVDLPCRMAQGMVISIGSMFMYMYVFMLLPICLVHSWPFAACVEP